IRVEIKNKERLTENKPCVYLANHQDNLDLITLGYACTPRTVAVGKKELNRIPLFGLLFKMTGNILLDRANREKAVGQLSDSAVDLRENNISVFMFPEGTRNWD